MPLHSETPSQPSFHPKELLAQDTHVELINSTEEVQPSVGGRDWAAKLLQGLSRAR